MYIFFVEQIGGEIIEELGDQREALERTRDRVKQSQIYIHGFYNHKISHTILLNVNIIVYFFCSSRMLIKAWVKAREF